MDDESSDCEHCNGTGYEPKNESAQSLGKLGGQATKAKYGVDHFKKIAKGWPKGKLRKVAKL